MTRRGRLDEHYFRDVGRVMFWAAVAGALAIAVLQIATGHAQDSPVGHAHPPQDEAAHERWYQTWMMPDQPAKSCCNKADCYPTIIKYDGGGRLWAQRREDGQWLLVPERKIERNRDNPDGRNHLCAPPPTATYYPPNTVFCFSLGGGI
jgi:hypothetical protein